MYKSDNSGTWFGIGKNPFLRNMGIKTRPRNSPKMPPSFPESTRKSCIYPVCRTFKYQYHTVVLPALDPSLNIPLLYPFSRLKTACPACTFALSSRHWILSLLHVQLSSAQMPLAVVGTTTTLIAFPECRLCVHVLVLGQCCLPQNNMHLSMLAPEHRNQSTVLNLPLRLSLKPGSRTSSTMVVDTVLCELC